MVDAVTDEERENGTTFLQNVQNHVKSVVFF
jgi:hypothetical protein